MHIRRNSWLFSIPFFLLLLLPWPALQGQLRTFVSLEAGPHWSMIKVDDRGSLFQAATVNASIAGLSVEQEIMEFLSVSTGFYYQPYRMGINMDDSRRFQSGTAAYNSILIPLRVHYRIQPTDYPVFFTPRLGYCYSINTLPDELLTQSSTLSTPGGRALESSQIQLDELPAGHLLEVGVSVSLRFPNFWRASLNLGYFTGVWNKESGLFDLSYTDHQGLNQVAKYTTQGNGLYTSLSVHAPLSHLWQNKQMRIRSRIEGSTFEGKGLERKGQLYLGGEVGALWRSFQSSNPAVGPRPMSGRGLLRHANLHTGIYAGYMLSNELGLDLGILYQRSSSFYALMYDHEVDFTGLAKAPLYLEVPLRLRYFYPVIGQDLHAVVYAGVSVLTHLSSGSYAGPSGSLNYTEALTQLPVDGSTSSTGSRPGRFKPLMRLGLGAEYKLPMDFPLIATLYLNHHKGFFTTDQLAVSTSLNEVPEQSTITYFGSGWSLDIGVKVPMSFDDRQDCVRLTRRKRSRDK